jgi:DNA-binding transcriptional LysR family regulator
MLAPILMVSFGWLLPESPRYLIEKGRLEDARESLLRLRRGKRGYTPDEDLAALEQAHEEAISAHGQAKWSDCFRGSDLKRTLIVLGIQCLQQGQGIGFMSQYLVSVAFGFARTGNSGC